MAALGHTYGAKCRLAPVVRADRYDDMPPVEAQYFYSSVIPIDDPLSTSAVSAPSETRPGKGQLRPFSRGDNIAIEKAWLSLISDADRRTHEHAVQSATGDLPLPPTDADQLASLIQELASKHWQRHRLLPQFRDGVDQAAGVIPNTRAPACCSELTVDVSEVLSRNFCAELRHRCPSLDHDEIVQQVAVVVDRRIRETTKKVTEARPSSSDLPFGRPGTATRAPDASPVSSRAPDFNDGVATRARSASQLSNPSLQNRTPTGSPVTRLAALEDGITGKPFIRVGSLESRPEAAPAKQHDAVQQNPPSSRSAPEDVVGGQGAGDNDAMPDRNDHKLEDVEVAVGVSRLHMVSLPMLQMKPIYWSPMNDVAIVTRATWFYRDTMLPIPPAVANQLEAGYHELRPWSQTWKDEICCAIEVGPLGEEKVSHRLWPKVPRDDEIEKPISSDPYCAARCFHGDAAAEGTIEWAPSAMKVAAETANKAFSSYHVIYKDANEAFLLKPSLKPSAYYGRRPVSKITKGVTVGIPAVRGFDHKVWDRIHDKKKTPGKPGLSAASQSHESSGQGVCSACKAEKERGQVNDLILVAHGIGQKFAERVESFHFTHAISSFRRAVNVELQSEIVQRVLRNDHNGLMILPLNWRTGLSFEDGGPMTEEDMAAQSSENFSLKDIEPDTIPAVRSMISDVMFDIPFYMSHHKSKMIKALVCEANRVYRLWCRNNPGFAERGRVHLIGHSLGSAMALEILSQQPTAVPKLDLSLKEPETMFFEFNTHNLFLLGSPAAFFLLLERGTLMPRRGRRKPGADANDIAAQHVVGDPGKFGCLAVDNIYNILAKEDPIAYLLNGSVDPMHAASLKTAFVPTIAGSLWKSITGALRSVVPGTSAPVDPLTPEPERPTTIRLPSQLELEVHDFTREEIAEKKFLLLNDNGQIDWYLPSGGGPLEIQYLNMLSAHTSYWTNVDFIRMLCIEIGREPGRANTLPIMRAVKATKRLLPQ